MTVTVGVCTRNRPDALRRCLRSLANDRVRGVIVVDDGSDPPLDPAALAAASPVPLELIRFPVGRGTAAGRNEVMRRAETPWVLNLDDDAFLLPDDSLARAASLLERDGSVAAVAFAQADARGTPWPVQPAAVAHPAVIASFTGYGYLARREALLALGGFLEPLEINGEERELCLRLMDGGLCVVFAPELRVGHVAAAAGRDPRRYLHQTVRNGVLATAHAFPVPLWPALALVRLMGYFPMRRGWQVRDPGGFGTVLRMIRGGLPAVLPTRRPVRWATLRRWRALVRSPEPYRGAV